MKNILSSKIVRSFVLIIILFSTLSVRALAAMPERVYVLTQNFPLLRFINPKFLRVYENRDRDRTYPPLMVCTAPNSDRRPTECFSGPGADKTCTGDVDICYRIAGETNEAGGLHHTERDVTGTCDVPKVVDANGDKSPPPDGTPGICRYWVKPTLPAKIQSTDYSNTDLGTVVYPKLQNDASHYDFIGNDNIISNGTQNLLLDACSRTIRQVIVVIKAKETKSTVAQTGQWPLGWVDWEFKTPNGKTLIEINDELPDSVSSAGKAVAAALDAIYSSLGNNPKDVTSDQQAICEAWSTSERENRGTDDSWSRDLAQSPIYPPSIKQGFARGSICVYDRCCPSVGSTCPLLPGENSGGSQALYTDASIQQTYAAALDDLFIRYQYDQALEIYKKIVFRNPALRWALRTDPAGTPPEIRKKLESEMKGTKWLDALPKGLDFKLAWLGSTYDYQHKMDSYGYEIQPKLDKQLGGSYYESPLQALINVVWPPSDKVDVVEPITYHLLTIPEVMGQSIAELQQHVYNLRDTYVELSDKYNESISSTVDDTTPDKLYVGKELGPANSQRTFSGYFSCADPYFSDRKLTSVEEYAIGTHYGCEKAKNATGLCDGTKFEEIIKDSPWQEPTAAAIKIVESSAMFKNGVLDPTLEAAYAAAEKQTGVPCEVLAGHHFEEGSASFTDGGDPTKISVANGGPASQDGGLNASAVTAAISLLKNPIGNTKQLVEAMSNFNGGGNSNCSSPTPYTGCPKKFTGEDDPYVTNMIDGTHNSMYLVYCDDFIKCNPPSPYGLDRPGAFAVALAVHKHLLGAPTSSASPSPSRSPSSTGSGSIFNPQGSCDDGYIDTALGCLPYESTAAIVAFLRLISGLAGGIALVIMLVATMQIMTAAGDTKKLQAGKDLFTSALVGLLFLIFSVSILQIIARNILRIPGF